MGCTLREATAANWLHPGFHLAADMPTKRPDYMLRMLSWSRGRGGLVSPMLQQSRVRVLLPVQLSKGAGQINDGKALWVSEEAAGDHSGRLAGEALRPGHGGCAANHRAR